ncbi:MAG TPA: hypothetical protein VJW93_01960 [Candidatus Acidoferrales bacterium]|nr:hypothetical protein [Candidatus Acidoferrales bacterium]
MPKSLDVLIGLSVIMLVVSMTVTMLTQATTSLLNSDGNRLRDGLRNLLVQIDPKLSGIAEDLTTAILTHPLIADSRGRLGSVIHRDEFTKLILDLAAGTGARQLEEESRKTLVEILKSNGIADPGTALDQIRMAAMKLEQEHPDWASSFRHDTAILQEAGSQFVAKINSMFDQTIDRVSSRFTASARVATFVCALVVAFILQLDTVGIVNSLWMSDSLRGQLVSVAENADQTGSDALPAVPHAAASAATTAVPTLPPAQSSANMTASVDTAEPSSQQNLDRNIQDLRQLASRGLLTLPETNLAAWWDSWRDVKIPGVILSALLLSLGAPFWYNTLKTLLGLREKIAAKDEAQRVTRQTSQANSGTGPTTFAS